MTKVMVPSKVLHSFRGKKTRCIQDCFSLFSVFSRTKAKHELTSNFLAPFIFYVSFSLLKRSQKNGLLKCRKQVFLSKNKKINQYVSPRIFFISIIFSKNILQKRIIYHYFLKMICIGNFAFQKVPVCYHSGCSFLSQLNTLQCTRQLKNKYLGRNKSQK